MRTLPTILIAAACLLPPDIERQMIEAALSQSRGRISGSTGAAAKLGIPRETLDRKILSLGIDKNQFKSH